MNWKDRYTALKAIKAATRPTEDVAKKPPRRVRTTYTEQDRRNDVDDERRQRQYNEY